MLPNTVDDTARSNRKIKTEGPSGLSLTQSTVIPILALSFIVIAILLLSLISGIFSSLDRLYKNQTQLMQDSFTKEVSQDILLGQHAEVYRRCQNLMQSKFVDQVRIRSEAGDEICAEQRDQDPPERSRILHSMVLFTENRTSSVAAHIDVTYDLRDQAQEERGILRLSLFVIAVVLLSSLAIHLLLRGWIVKPLVRIRGSLQTTDIGALGSHLRPMVLRVREICDLRDELVDMADRIVHYQHKEIESKSLLAAAETAQQVAHDIRSPLSAMNLIAARLRLRGEPEGEVLHQAAQRVHEIAEDVLAGTREAAGIAVRVSTRDLLEDFQACIGVFRADLQDGHIHAEFNLNTDTLVQVNRSHLKRIFDNLLRNSIEARCSDRSLQILVFGYLDNKNMILTVEDNGKGIPPRILDRLGKEQVTAGKAKGTGIGLLSLFRRVRDWSGDVRIESTPNQGTKVWIELPLLDRI